MESEGTTNTTRPRAPRIVLRVADPEKFRIHYVPDLADGGVFVKSEKLLPQGAVVEVELYPPGWDEPLPLHGRIARRVEPGGPATAGMHVSFENLESAVSRRLHDLVGTFSRSEVPSDEGPTPTAVRSPPAVLADEPVPLPLPAFPEGTADRSREIAELRGRLVAAEATIATLRAELSAHEEDEAGTRALAERLALQKNKLERARKKETEEAAVVGERLRRELAERAAALAALETRAAEAGARAEVEHKARDEAEGRAADWKSRCDEALARVERLSARVDELERTAFDAKERAAGEEGRRQVVEAELVAAREAGAEHERRAIVLARELEAAGEAHAAEKARFEKRIRSAEERLGEMQAREANLEARLALSEDRLGKLRTKEKDLRRLLEVVSAKAAEEPEEGARDPVELPVEVEDTLTSRATDRDVSGVIIAADLLMEAGIDLGVESPEGDIAVHVDEDGGDEPPSGGISLAEFVDRLRNGTRFRRTETFRRFKPAEPSEIRLGGWLVQADGLDALRELASGKVSEERLHRLLFDFYRRGLVEFVD